MYVKNVGKIIAIIFVNIVLQFFVIFAQKIVKRNIKINTASCKTGD